MMKYLWLLLLAIPLHGQSWYKVATESPQTTIAMPAGTTYRFGLGTCWSGSITVTAQTTLTANFPFSSCPNVPPKEIDILQTAVDQVVKVNKTSVTVPAVGTAPVPPATIVMTINCDITVYSDGRAISTTCKQVGK
jgi:hypothetical protein